MCAQPLFVCLTRPSHVLGEQLPSTVLPPETENNIYLLVWSTYMRLWKKTIRKHLSTSRENTNAQQSTSTESTSAQNKHYSSCLAISFPAGLCKCCSLCRNMQSTEGSPTQISKNVQHKAQHSLNPPSKSVASSFSSSFYQAAGQFKMVRTQILLPFHQEGQN